MGFYIRKSISAGPFRFNLSSGGLGLSVGVKGFRVGTGPRGNYVHMGRGGLYYRASLGGSPRRQSSTVPAPQSARFQPDGESLSAIESGDVVAMKPANGSDIVQQINDRMGMLPFWPWLLVSGGALAAVSFSTPNAQPLGIAALVVAVVLSLVTRRFDRQRKTVVIMYDLDEQATEPFRRFTEEFDKFAAVHRVWNVDTAGRTSDWKRNAGAGRLVTRRDAKFGYAVPSVVKTNIEVPAIVGGRQNIHFFPDVALIVEGKRVGAASYDQLDIAWNTTVFVEDQQVPSDAQVVGHTWRYVNRDGGPDRRFSNNRQLPEVLYMQMGLKGPEGFQKIVQFSKVMDHAGFDAALNSMRELVRKLLAFDSSREPRADSRVLEATQGKPSPADNVSEAARQIIRDRPKHWEYKLTLELLRSRVEPIIERWHRLERGTYDGPSAAISSQEAMNWCQSRLDETREFAETWSRLVNVELPASWGPPGKPGDAEQICRVCEKFRECAQRVLDWEEKVRFSAVPENFRRVRGLLQGIAGRILDQIARISTELGRVFSQENPSGNIQISLALDLPEHWTEAFKTALAEASGIRRRG